MISFTGVDANIVIVIVLGVNGAHLSPTIHLLHVDIKTICLREPHIFIGKSL